MEIWVIMRAIHLLAMAFFVGGQLMLAATIVPVLKGNDAMVPVARRFAWGSLIALLVLILTGAYMASHYHEWSDPLLIAKIALLIVVAGLIHFHMQNGQKHWLAPLIFVISLTIMVLGVQLAHG
jgi:putative copper export protein